jgi:hypothetical protein
MSQPYPFVWRIHGELTQKQNGSLLIGLTTIRGSSLQHSLTLLGACDILRPETSCGAPFLVLSSQSSQVRR